MLPEQIKNQLNILKEEIQQATDIALFGHENIDPDSAWAMLWFGLVLEKLGKHVSYFTSIAPTESNQFMHWIKKIKTNFDYGKYDLIFFVDFSGYERISWITKDHESYFDTKKKIIIDHHIETEEKPNSFVLRDIDSGSTCGLCYEIVSTLWNEYIDKESATLRYTWLLTDTGNFMRSKDAQRDYSIAGNLINLWADKDSIIKNLYFCSHHWLIDMASTTLGRAKILWDVVYTWYTQEELDNFGISDDEIEKAHMLLRWLKNIPIFLRLRKDWNQWKWSLRSAWDAEGNRYNVERIASSFPRWGGHIYASWFSIDAVPELWLEDNVQEILKHIQKQIDIQKTNRKVQ